MLNATQKVLAALSATDQRDADLVRQTGLSAWTVARALRELNGHGYAAIGDYAWIRTAAGHEVVVAWPARR